MHVVAAGSFLACGESGAYAPPCYVELSCSEQAVYLKVFIIVRPRICSSRVFILSISFGSLLIPQSDLASSLSSAYIDTVFQSVPVHVFARKR